MRAGLDGSRNRRAQSDAPYLSVHERQIFPIAVGALVMAASCGFLSAQSVTVPNFSFETPSAPNTFPFVNTSVGSWQKAPEPAYYGPAIGTPFGIPWDSTAGVFLDVNPTQITTVSRQDIYWIPGGDSLSGL
jgi:hypothetical protein